MRRRTARKKLREDKKDMTDHVYPQQNLEQAEHTGPPEKWYTPIQLRPWVVRVIGYRPKTKTNSEPSKKSPVPQRKIKKAEHTGPPEKWYTPIQLRPWVVRIMGYRPKTKTDSEPSKKSPFRQFIEEIVTKKIGEHLGAQNATGSRVAAQTSAGELSTTENTTDDDGPAANLAHNLEELLGSLSRAEAGFAQQHGPASTGTAQNALGVAQDTPGTQTSPATQFPVPKTPTSSRREPRKSRRRLVMDFLMRDLPTPDPARRPTATSASTSESIAAERLEHNPRSDPRSNDNTLAWPPKRRSRDRGHQQRHQAGKHDSSLDRAGMSRRNRRYQDGDRGVEMTGAANDDTSESESSRSISAQVCQSDDDTDHRLAPHGNPTASARPGLNMNIPSRKRRRG